jgi:hypothetical protein
LKGGKEKMNEITETQGKKAFEIHKDILALNRKIGISFIEIGRLLKLVRDEGYYKVLGYDTFTSYVVNSELGFKRRKAYYYIEIYEWYVEKLAYSREYLAEIGQEKLLKVLPVVKKECGQLSLPKMQDRINDLIVDAQELRPVDFDRKYKDEKLNEGHDKYLAPPEYFRCDKCGKWIIVVPKEDCCPDWLKKFGGKK